MKFIVTGLPRCRTSIISKKVGQQFNLDSPANQWSETHKFNESRDDWLVRDNCIFKLWAIHIDDYINTLENYPGNIIVSYTTDLPMFVAKLARSHITHEWGTTIRDKDTISFNDNMEKFKELIPVVNTFRESLDKVFSSKKILLKSAFVNEDRVGIHIQSTFDTSVAESLRGIVCNYTPSSITDYINEDPREFYEYIHNTFGCKF